jgi:hypothetical protein
VTDTNTPTEGRPDDEDAGGPAHPAPGHLPPDSPESESPAAADEPDSEEDEPGGPAHPAPGHLPPDSPETESGRP